ncbi:MAG: Flp pilus assembly complex ATPase component TadA [Candidatus Cloacimonetes bacterium]|nr:Flp pilus assembly complex ATPase component TadA [Candidatus Cloacimonadota bacterium]MCF7813645.1 Flp pilus assembly complex ATPase component TadA [Candidatus Cloacimonadota bacterium]MCF7868324.1 Flp pilus assembly complex ATPase component TadA [Candidatus Cloacimonadota bacterium]MCF7883798.1 Flp pilus assembly complex ATPase component TadA [Candidatus Cloacimonadota bacterium]
MGFSFLTELQNSIPGFQSGAERAASIDKLLMKHESWREEAYHDLKSLMKQMRSYEASDIDIGGPGCNGFIWLRIFGLKNPYKKLGRYTEDEITCMLLAILNQNQIYTLLEKKNIDFSMSFDLENGNSKPTRFRGNVYFECNEIVANFRRINDHLMHITELGFADSINRQLNLKYEKSGLYLVTGITGSGKSTTLDSIIDMNNKINHGHIVIISNPIEFVHDSIKCIVRHREVGDDVESFQKGTHQAFRQDPDIIVVGEMRDPQTIATVLEATDSGHKVFSTLHTSNAVDSIHRIIAEFPPAEQERVRMRLADTLRVIISQKLVPTKKGDLLMCKEVLSVDSSVKAAIRNKNIGEIYQMINEGKKSGMITMEQDLYNHYITGKITKDTALNYANNTKRMNQLIQYSS